MQSREEPVKDITMPLLLKPNAQLGSSPAYEYATNDKPFGSRALTMKLHNVSRASKITFWNKFLLRICVTYVWPTNATFASSLCAATAIESFTTRTSEQSSSAATSSLEMKGSNSFRKFSNSICRHGHKKCALVLGRMQ